MEELRSVHAGDPCTIQLARRYIPIAIEARRTWSRETTFELLYTAVPEHLLFVWSLPLLLPPALSGYTAPTLNVTAHRHTFHDPEPLRRPTAALSVCPETSRQPKLLWPDEHDHDCETCSLERHQHSHPLPPTTTARNSRIPTQRSNAGIGSHDIARIMTDSPPVLFANPAINPPRLTSPCLLYTSPSPRDS